MQREMFPCVSETVKNVPRLSPVEGEEGGKSIRSVSRHMLSSQKMKARNKNGLH